MKRGQKQKGFTIVELLVVIVVIGVLAAISVVAYNGFQARAQDSVIRSDLSTLVKKIELRAVENDGSYYYRDGLPDDMQIRVSKGAYMPSRNNLYVCTDATNYAIAAVSKSGKAFYYAKSTGYGSDVNGSTFYVSNTCSLIGLTYQTPMPAGTGAFAGFDWNSSTSSGVWDSWAQG